MANARKLHILYFLMAFSFISIQAKQMRVLFVVSSFPPKSGTAVLNQMTGLIDRGHIVRIFAGRRGNIDWAHPAMKKYNLLEKTKFAKKKKQLEVPFNLNDFDIVYCQFGHKGQKFAELKKKTRFRAKLVTCFRGADITKYIADQKGPYKELFEEGDLFLPVCEAFKEKLIKHGCDPNKVIVHHSAINCNRFKFKNRKPSNDGIQLVSVCRLVEKKGLEYAIKAIARLRKKYNKVTYTIVGFGSLEKKLRRLINKLQLDGVVTLFGRGSEEEIAHILDQSHIFILPSITSSEGDQEGIPNALKEAMACGLPVISTYHSGIPELITHKKSGFLVPEKNSKELTKYLIYLIQNKKIWRKMGEKARTKVENEYDMEQVNDKLIQLFENLVS